MNHQNNSSTQFLKEKTIARMAWEQSYLEALIDHLKPTGEVLEVGFALGYSADRIQAFHPKHHTIIEPNPTIAAKAVKWANNNPAISIIQDVWEDALPKLGVFDAIFFNDIKPELEAEKAQQLDTTNMLVKKGEELIANVKMQLPQIMSIKYTDSDLDTFFSQVNQFQPHEMANFLHELMRNKQISEEQYEKMLSKQGLQKTTSPTPKMREKPTDPMLVFLKACLKNHMRKGSRFSCFATSPLSKFENPEFFEAVITNPNCDYQEKTIPVDVPKSCEYYKYKSALIMIVEKQDQGNV